MVFPSNMKYILTFSFMLILIIFYLIPSGIKDCKNDIVCFNESLASCQKAKIVSDYPFPWFGSATDKMTPISVDSFFETTTTIINGDLNGCAISSDISLKDPSFIENIILFLELDRFMDSDTGSMTCIAPLEEYYDAYFPYRVFDYCDGYYMDNLDRDTFEFEMNIRKFSEQLENIEYIHDSLDVGTVSQYDFHVPFVIEMTDYFPDDSLYIYTISDTGEKEFSFFTKIGIIPKQEGIYHISLVKRENAIEVLSSEKIE